MPRMHILTASEQKAFDAPPVFSYAERDTFFQVSERLDAILATLRSPTNRVGLVLTVGYFRATKRFFPPVVRKNAVTLSPSQWAKQALCYVPMGARATGEHQIEEVGTAPAPGVSQQ